MLRSWPTGRTWLSIFGLLICGVPALAEEETAATPSFTADQLEFFENKIRPLFVKRCYSCHSASADELSGGLRVDSRQGLLDGGDSGGVIIPGDPDSSYLLDVLSYEGDVQMPPRGQLGRSEIADVRKWIEDGAAWPDEPPPGEHTAQGFNLAERKASHWCWQAVTAPAIPAVKKADWVRDPLDTFILARLEAVGLSPADEAGRHALLRRVSYDLTGLPPTPAELAEFLADTSPQAYEKAVDRLLASPHFGERWARHWLDLMRYAETYGHEFDYPIFQAWRYRDYVTRAFNADVPYNQFIIEHVAGDLMTQPRLHPVDGTNESILATAFWFLGEQTHAPVDSLQHQADRIDNQIDVMGKAFLGVTLGCARCHDHKFDAISTRDVYSLWSFMQSSRMVRTSLDPYGKVAAAARRLEALARSGDEVLAPLLTAQAEVPAAQAESPPPPAAQPAADEPLVFETFDKPGYEGWFVDGQAFGKSPTLHGQWDSFTGKPQWAVPGVAHSGMLSPRLKGALRSRTFTIAHDRVWIRAAGRGARLRLIIDGFQMDEHSALLFEGLIINLDDDKMAWRDIHGALPRYRGHRAYIELLDQGDGYVAIDEIVFSNSGAPPRDEAQPVQAAVDATAAARLQELLDQRNRISAELPQQTDVLAIADGNGVDQHVYVRGSHKTLGEVAPRRFLEAVCGPDQPRLSDSGSGRLQLAMEIVDPENPLTSRVMVNRLWHHLFGRGLVASTDNFGVLGQEPTHPELLDHLADRFIREGWSIKQMIRAMVLSSTYRMSSTPSAQALEVDPQNLLLQHTNVRRLQAEAIRDAVLAVSGRLDRTMYGPSVPVHLTNFMQGRGRPGHSGPLDGNGRRSLYIEIRRNFLSPMMLAFDAPSPFATVGTRSVSNVPAQALTMLNDRMIRQEMERWGKRMVEEVPGDVNKRISAMYVTAFAREPSAEELRLAAEFISSQGKQYGLQEAQQLTDPRPWSDLAQVLVNCKEFIFLE